MTSIQTQLYLTKISHAKTCQNLALTKFSKAYLDHKPNQPIDFSCNSLMGHIPEEIHLLIGLTNLNLSRNQFSGAIPNQIGDLKRLESLDLSYNEFSGQIPSSLSALTSLSYLNLSYNNLSGTIHWKHTGQPS